ncbi:MAG TPA: PilZ domain-containing protein [Terriglobales bacterium]|jgi:DNA-binding response OmpR family regulator
MSLQSLVFCSDDKILRVLRRVLSDLDIQMDHCLNADSTIHKITRQRYEAIIVDCSDEATASPILKSIRSAPSNKRAIAVAILDAQTAVRGAFDLGAHFVLYKPISNERAKSSFRAARALMKSERRRNQRIPVQIPVVLHTKDGMRQEAVTSDLGEGGMAVQTSKISKRRDQKLFAEFTLPDTDFKCDCLVEVAWENTARQSGIRFTDLTPEVRERLRMWFNQHSTMPESDDPPMACKLTDLSTGGCYLEANTPFPMRAKVILSLALPGAKVQVSGVVRVMHPEKGMGVEFNQVTDEQCGLVEDFLKSLTDSAEGTNPEIMVEPEGLQSSDPADEEQAISKGIYDPLLDLFRRGLDLTFEEFQTEMHKQRGKKTKTASVSI